MGKSIVYCLSGYNNYFNRIIKLNDTPAKVEDHIVITLPGVDFNPNDNVNTEWVCNYLTLADKTDIDYLMVEDPEAGTLTRWFCTDRDRTRQGQWRLSLKRDLIADFWPEVSSSPVYIEKGWLSTTSKLIYNSENISVNQIKTKELLLKDKTNCPWIVGYIGNDYLESSALAKEEGNYNVYFTRDVARTAAYQASYSEYKALADKGTIYTGATTSAQELRFVISCPNIYYAWQISDKTGVYNQMFLPNESNLVCDTAAYSIQRLAAYTASTRASDKYYISLATLPSYISNYVSNIDQAKSFSGKLVKNTDSSGPAFFYLNVQSQGSVDYIVNPPAGSSVYNQIKNHIAKLAQNTPPDRYGDTIAGDFYWDDSGPNKFDVHVPVQKYTVSISTEPPLIKCRTSIGGYTEKENVPKQRLQDAPFTMFCMPYYDVNVKRSGTDSIEYSAEGRINLEMAAAISTTLGGGANGSSYIFDLQLLPFCPISEIYDSSGKINLTGLDPSTYSIITAEDSDHQYTAANNCGIVLYCKRSSFNGVIELAEPITVSQDTLEFKVANEAQFVRLVSPNYAGAFEFKPTSNGGCSAIEFNCTYKPYQPYIHLNPVFNAGFLYGGDYNDNRGLICGGSFSLPQTTDAWVNYQIQNKSYQEAHDRQIENMEINNAAQREKEKWQIAAGTVSSAVSGGVSGGMLGGNPYTAAAGAAIGLGTSLLGGIKDLELNDRLRAEGIDYTKDMFGYQLQNIQAMPNTMSRTSAFDINNKLFPFLEFYDCTDLEKQVIKDKITYNGCTVMAIGKITDYTDLTGKYVKGQLIRLIDSDGKPVADFHEAAAIASELMKGVFI